MIKSILEKSLGKPGMKLIHGEKRLLRKNDAVIAKNAAASLERNRLRLENILVFMRLTV